MPSWPAGLPFFNSRSGYRMEAATGNTIETQMSVGVPKRRRRGSSAPRPFKGRISNFPVGLLETLEQFWFDDLLEGSLSFEATDPLTGVTRTYQLLGYSYRPDKPLTLIIEGDLRVVG